ncbi:MAG: undecaprenyl-diphosphate phosphatase [Aquificae bacterium]|nr:undecaprenyl-diphosphate phosphatase [Aquificota bacterium]
MNTWQAIVLGIVEGLTEFLPVSSTGHLILTAKLLGIPHTEFVKSFEISIQLGAILAVVLLYRDRLTRDFGVWERIIVAFLPTALVGFTLYKLIKGFLIGNELVVVSALVLGGFVLLFADRLCERGCEIGEINELPLRKAFVIGLFQSLAVIPGVSRSGATIVGGMLVGLRREKSAEFSFLLAVPTMLSASAYDLLRSHTHFSAGDWGILGVGFVSSFLSALFVVRWFLSYLKRHGLWVFGVYRILLGLIYASFFLF